MMGTVSYEAFEQAAIELESRRRGRSNLIGFTEYTNRAYVSEPVHELIASKLDLVLAGTIKRLIISAPPQIGKSELASVRFPSFWLGNRPDDPILLTSYGADLAHGKSAMARDVVGSHEFSTLFPDVRIRSNRRAAHEWHIGGHRGYLKAAGAGGPITGHGTPLGIIDDPFESWEQAQSATYRQKIWEWYRGTFRTRIWEGGAIVIIMTRWHQDDLVGRLIRQDPNEWFILRLPAIAEGYTERKKNDQYIGITPTKRDPLGRRKGAPLSPNRFSKAYMEKTRSEVGPLVWAAEYQGVPRPLEGVLFKRHMFNILAEPPAKFDSLVRYWDLAGSVEDGSAYTAGVLMGRKGARYYVLDVVRDRVITHDRNVLMKNTAIMDTQKYGDVETWFEREPGSSGLDAARMIVTFLAGFQVSHNLPTGDKITRAMTYHAQCAAGNVFVLARSWTQEYLDEITAFPNQAIKDQVDGSSGAFIRLAGKQNPTWR